MEKIFDYIVFNIIMLQKIRGITNKINKDNLEVIINTIINNLNVDKKYKEELLDNFYIDDEVNRFINDYFDYFYIDNNTIYLEDDVSLGKLQRLVCINGIDKTIRDDIFDLLEENLKIKELYGVTVRKDIYNYMHTLYKKANELYNSNGQLDVESLKKILFKINILSFNIENSMAIPEIMDLQLYIEDKIKNKKRKIVFNIENNHFSNEELEEDPFFLSLLGKTDTEDDIIRYRNELLFARSVPELYKENLEDYNFYLKYYYLLIDEIDNTKDINIKDKLISAKNNLMKTIDLIFGNTLFMDRDNSDKLLHDLDGVYYRYLYTSYFFIDELLSYRDSDYLDDDVKFENIIKKNFIKVYYEITKDKTIKDVIEESILDEDNSISSSMLEKIIKDNDVKKREK